MKASLYVHYKVKIFLEGLRGRKILYLYVKIFPKIRKLIFRFIYLHLCTYLMSEWVKLSSYLSSII